MVMAIEQGWLEGVRRLPSPNCDERPPAAAVDMIVVHGISLPPGRYGLGHIDALFTNTLDEQTDPFFQPLKELRVSAHLLIDRHGDLTQYVSFEQRAWHAGESCFEGRECCNDYSVGIELEGCDDQLYEASQYVTLGTVIAALMQYYPLIPRHRIVGHRDIAPGRKSDPGPAFDWRKLNSLLDEQSMLI